MHTKPDTTAIAPASAIARAGSAPDNGSTTARMIAAKEESGPSTSIRLGPNSAYASNPTIVAYKPWMPGTPDATAYAMPTGISIAVSTSPATRSRRSHAI
jgi:hypothetical protein